MTVYIRGPIATYNRVENIQPEDWTKKITQILPYGQTPITAIMDTLTTEKTESRKFHWWSEKEMPLNGNITGIYTDSSLSNLLLSSATKDTVLYIKMSEEDAAKILVNNTLSIIGKPDINNSEKITFTDIVMCDVRAVTIDGNNSKITVKLLDDLPDISAPNSSQLPLCWFISGNAQEEGAMLPESVTTEPVEYENQTQIFMGSCEITNSALQELERVEPDKWERTIAKALVRLRKEMEYQVIFGKLKTSWVNGKQKRHTRGIYEAIKTYAPTNIFNIAKYYTVDTKFEGKTWADAGYDILNDIIERTSRIKTDADSKFVFTGSKGFMAINSLVQNSTMFQWSSEETIFGFRVKSLLGAIKTLNFVIHPLFNENERFNRSALVIEGRYIKKKVFRPLMFISGKESEDENGYDWIDGRKCGWLEEFGVAWDFIENFCWIDNLGIDVENP